MPIDESEFPCYYIDSDRASKTAQRRYKGINWLALALMLLSTIMASISTKVTIEIPQFDKINGVILLVAGLTSLVLNYTQPEQKWYLGRAIAESMKTLTWRYMMHTEPFKSGDPKQDLQNFTDRISAINSEANKSGFIPKPNKRHNNVITKKMKEVRNLEYGERKAYYEENRIDDQIKWYRKKSEISRKRANWYSFFMILFQFLAALYLFELFDVIKIVNLNNILVFLATSIIGIIEMNKYKELHASYAFTGQELNIIKTNMENISNGNELSQFVLEAEQAISREHTTWLARRKAT